MNVDSADEISRRGDVSFFATVYKYLGAIVNAGAAKPDLISE